jgi:phage terminase Nu1 subunit (DNA packaging protein)
VAERASPVYPATVIAKLFNLTERHVQRLAKDGIIPKAARGKYELVGCVQGYVRYLQERAMGGDINSTDFGTENIRVKKLTADKLQLEVDVLKGNLVPRELIEDELANIILTARAKLLGLPSRLAKIAIASESLREIEVAAKNIVYEVLEELSNDKSADTIQSLEAPTRTNNIRVGQ